MKRLMLVWVMILCLVPVGGWAESTEKPASEPLVYGDFTYTVCEDGSAEITGYTGTETDVVIPSAVDGHPVTAIGDHAFQFFSGRIRITGVILPEGIRKIGNYAFASSRLSSVVLPEGIDTIGQCAFNSCDLTAVELPESLVSIGESAFSGNGLTEIYLPRSLAELGGPNCFGDSLASIGVSPDNPYWYVANDLLFRTEDACLFLCPGGLGLTVCEIPEGTAVIGKRAFAGNENLISVTVPEGVTVIEENALYNCYKLLEITLPGSLREIKAQAFRDCSLTSLPLPEGLVSLGDYVFECCIDLASVSLPVTLTDVGANPFSECKQLCEITVSENNPALRFERGMLCDRNEGVLICFAPGSPETDCTIPDGITVIGTGAFSETYIKTVTIPDGVAEIGDEAFVECHALETVTLPESLRSIGTESFSFCGLDAVDLPEGLVSIGEGAFWACELESVRIPSTVREIAGNPFMYCDQLILITVAPENPYYESVGGALINKAEKRLICYPDGLRHPRYDIPAGVQIIGSEACSMTEAPCEITVPEGVMALEDRCFCYCTDVDIYLPASVTVISPSAFYDQGSRGPILHVVPGSAAEAYCMEKGLRCVPQESE